MDLKSSTSAYMQVTAFCVYSNVDEKLLLEGISKKSSLSGYKLAERMIKIKCDL